MSEDNLKHPIVKTRQKRKRSDKDASLISTPLVKVGEGEKWYQSTSEERLEGNAKNADICEVEKNAAFLLQRDVDLYNQLERKGGGSEGIWLSTMAIKGTAADKISAMQVLIQRSPVHALSHVSMLVSIVEKKNIRGAYSTLGVLKEIFINELLPPTRKLIPLSMRPLADLKRLSAGSQQNMERRLILWKFESDLKRIYETFIDAIEKLAGGVVENVCTEAFRTALDLLAERPEQEQRLLSLLVNKLGHPNHRLASRLIGYLLQLSRRQPNMRPVIVKEIERLIYRKNISCRAQLYAISFLSQLQLRAGEVDLATSLLNIYIGLFRTLVMKQKMDDKMLSVLLAATNRAFPYAKGEVGKLMKEIDTLYKVLHQSNFATAIQTLKLLYQLLLNSEGISDRFYAALYRKLLDVGHSSSRERQLFDLLVKALKNDSMDQRVIAFIKRLLQLSLSRSAAFATAALILISKILEERPSLLILSKTSDRKVDEYALKMESVSLSNDDDEEERYFDVPESSLATSADDTVEEKPDVKKTSACGWVHKDNIPLRIEGTRYDRTARNPLFAHAELSVASELVPLSRHYHPTVAIFASNLLSGIAVRYDGDPLVDFTPMRFLDRFVYRNPKTSEKNARKGDKNVFRRKAYDPLGIKKLAVTSEEYLSKKRDEIPADERFLHRFATLKPRVKKEVDKEAEGKEKDERDFDDIESVNSEEFNVLLERFEIGEKNEIFDVDFAKEFRMEKKHKRQLKGKRKAESVDQEESEVDANEGLDDDDVEDLDDGDMEDDGIDKEDESDEKEDSEEDYDGVLEGEGSDSDGPFRKQASDAESDSDDEFEQQLDFADDAAISADKFAEMMEEETAEPKRKSKRKTRKARGFKKRRTR
uniref:CCAAT-binding factor domain-containing protein n=1 Tax=Parascaris univalens TaxID=6257 RepID=A0A915ASH1_PARUN